MAVNKKPRKRHKPRPEQVPIMFALREEQKIDLRLPPQIVLDAFKRGQGDACGANTLAACVNLGAVLSRSQSREVQEVIEAGMDAVSSILKRGSEGKWGLTGDELKAISEALNLTEEMQDASTRREVRDAIATFYREATV